MNNVGYLIIYNLCKSKNNNKTYEGDTCRNGFIRGKEHAKQFEKNSENSVMFKHAIEDNKNELDSAQFSMKIQ